MNAIASLFHITITIPLFEYGIHYALHMINNKTHKEHHIENHNKKNKIEKYILWVIPPLLYSELTVLRVLSLGLFQYWLVHTLIHFYPKYLPKMIVNHHITHHNNPNCNYAVSNPYIDIIFRTKT
tara:strand:+ start:883 stop:1257 length:375 start_codon:yes stop_codon:yes gene_type:complete